MGGVYANFGKLLNCIKLNCRPVGIATARNSGISTALSVGYNFLWSSNIGPNSKLPLSPGALAC